MSYRATITNEEASALPVEGWAGRIVVADDAESLAEAERLLESARALGIDTETRPAFQKGVVYPVSLLQLSTDQATVLVRLAKVGLSDALVRLLQDEKTPKIGAALRDDIKALQKIRSFTPRGFVDLQNEVHRWGIEEKSVRKMAAIVLGFKVSKAQRLTNWDAVRLTEAQQRYAATDSWVCLEIWNKLNGRN